MRCWSLAPGELGSSCCACMACAEAGSASFNCEQQVALSQTQTQQPCMASLQQSTARSGHEAPSAKAQEFTEEKE